MHPAMGPTRGSAPSANITCRHHPKPRNLVQAWSRRRPSPIPVAAASAADGANAAPTAPQAAQHHPLVSFVLSNGGAVDGVKPQAETSQGWGLAADRDLPKGHRCVVLPPRCHLAFEQTADAAAAGADGQQSAALAALASDIPPELWGAKLALALLRERALGPESSYAPYVEALPAAFPGVPLFWGPEAIAALDYPPVAEQVKKRCRWLHEFASKHFAGGDDGDQAKAALAGARVDVSGLGWAMAAVTSRAFRVGGLDKPAALLPLVDLCNHDFDPNAEVVPYEGGGSGSNRKKGGVAVVTRRPLKKGEPVLLSYGPLPNDFLLLDYGFLVENNPHDAVSLRFDASGLLTAGAAAAGVLKEEAWGTGGGGGGPELLDFGEELERSAYKRRRLAALGLMSSGNGSSSSSLEVALGAGLPGGAPVADPRLLAAARLLASRHAAETEGLPDRELGAWSRSADSSAAAPLGNKANEVAALRTLAGVAGIALSRFGSTLDEDEAALRVLQGAEGAIEGLDRGTRRDVSLAVRLRAGKKRVLLSAVEALGKRVEALKARRDVAAFPADGSGGRGGGGKKKPATDRGFGAAKKR
jgi:histone-lysine N-methyltransferase SETD3